MRHVSHMKEAIFTNKLSHVSQHMRMSDIGMRIHDADAHTQTDGEIAGDRDARGL